MGNNNPRCIRKTVRLTEDEYKLLERKMKEAQEKNFHKEKEGFSGFMRETLLERNGAYTSLLKMQLSDLRYEIRKIGVNINQATKKINGGIGSVVDVRVLENSLADVEDLLKDYQDKMEAAWQSQN